MEEMQERQAASPIARAEQPQGYSMPGEQPGDVTLLRQEPTTPWYGPKAPGSFWRSMRPPHETQPSGTPPAAIGFDPEYPSLSIVIPTWNEAANLPYVLPCIPTIIDEVILVDGRSTDGTIEVAQRLLPGIRVIEQKGKGKGDAIRAGLEAATGDIIVMLDADGSADPQEIPTFVEALLVGYDYAKGSRFMKGGGSRDITMLRRFGNYGLCGLVNLLFGTRFSDLCYGYNAFWKHCLDHVAIDSDGFEVETLINIRMHRAGLKIAEVPSFEHRRIHGVSNLNALRDGWRVLKTILRERKRKASFVPRPLQVEPVISAVEHVLKSEEIIL